MTNWEKYYKNKKFFINTLEPSKIVLTGLKKPKIHDIKIQWKFKNKKEIGIFLYKIHAMTKTTPEKCLKGAEKILGVEKKNNEYYLNWPIKILTTKKNNYK